MRREKYEGNTTKTKLTDLLTLFHLRYVKGYRGLDENHWQNMIDSPSRRAWSGYSFEQLELQNNMMSVCVNEQKCSVLQPKHIKRCIKLL